MTWARIEAGVVVETIDFDPKGRFSPELVWTVVKDSVETKWVVGLDGTLGPPPPPTPPPAPSPDEVINSAVTLVQFAEVIPELAGVIAPAQTPKLQALATKIEALLPKAG